MGHVDKNRELPSLMDKEHFKALLLEKLMSVGHREKRVGSVDQYFTGYADKDKSLERIANALEVIATLMIENHFPEVE